MHRRAVILAGALSLFIGAESAEARLEILVEKASQRMVVIQDGYMRYIWPVSTGRDNLQTPTGIYTPQRMERNWFSTAYYGSPMPYAIFFHNGYAIHGSYAINQLGGPASHGCVRLHPHHAALLFDLAQQEGRENTTIEVTDEPQLNMPPIAPRPSEQIRQISLAVPRPEQVVPRPELGIPRPELAAPRQEQAMPGPEQAMPRPEQAGPRSDRFARFDDMGEYGGPRSDRPAMMRTPLPLRSPPANRRVLTNPVEPNPPRAPCSVRPDAPDCRPRPKSVEAAPRERAEAVPRERAEVAPRERAEVASLAQAPTPVPSARPEPQAAPIKVLPASCWSGGASRWRWWSGQNMPCK